MAKAKATPKKQSSDSFIPEDLTAGGNSYVKFGQGNTKFRRQETRAHKTGRW